jgi:hypothetical protein
MIPKMDRRLFYDIISELHASEEVSLNNDMYNCRMKFLNDIKYRMCLYAQDMSQLSEYHNQLHNARELQLCNKEHEKTMQKQLKKIRDYISNRYKNNVIVNQNLKDNYDRDINYLTEKLQKIYMEINNLNVQHNKKAGAHAAAVHHAIQQALKEDEIYTYTYNQKQCEKNYLLFELEQKCKLEQQHIKQINEFNRQHNMYMHMHMYSDIYPSAYKKQEQKFNQEIDLDQEQKFNQEIDLDQKQKFNQEIDLDQDQKQKFNQEIDLDQDLISDWINTVD